MSSVGQHEFRLRAYLAALTPDARHRLRDGLERGTARGQTFEAEAALAELQRLDGSDTTAARLFFQPLELFLVDTDLARASAGFIARAALPALWAWIAHDLAPDDAADFTQAATDAFDAGDTARAQSLANAFQDRIVATLRAVFADDNAAARNRLLRSIGTPRAADEAAVLRWALRGRDALAVLGHRLPAAIDHLPHAQIPACIALIEDAARPRDVFRCALIVVMRRLAQPWQIVRLAAHVAGSNSAARIEATPYGVAVDLLLAEVERQIAALDAAVSNRHGAEAVALIRSIDAILQGLRGEIAIPQGSTLGRRLSTLSAEAAAVARSAIAA